MKCYLCAKNCGTVRNENECSGNCGMPTKIKIAHYELFMYEEPCVSVGRGSGAIFFSGCNLNCVFCQNYEISTKKKGKFITTEDLVNIFKELESSGAENINLVSPTHYALQIVEALKIYKPKIPVIYNTNSYENVKTIEFVAPYVDVFLPDFKYVSRELSSKFSSASNYKQVALSAIKKMRELKQDKFVGGKIVEGVIIRHMILPLCTNDSISVLETIAQEIPNTKVSLLAQYTPYGEASSFKAINRKITAREYNKVLNKYIELNLDGYIQELESASTKYIPKFKFIN